MEFSGYIELNYIGHKQRNRKIETRFTDYKGKEEEKCAKRPALSEVKNILSKVNIQLWRQSVIQWVLLQKQMKVTPVERQAQRQRGGRFQDYRTMFEGAWFYGHSSKIGRGFLYTLNSLQITNYIHRISQV